MSPRWLDSLSLSLLPRNERWKQTLFLPFAEDSEKQNKRKAKQPTNGIHSQIWCDKITPQSSALFRLSTDVRLLIWEQALIASVNQRIVYIEPRKLKWTPAFAIGESNQPRDSPQNLLIDQLYKLYSICRQAYVEIVGGGLLYKQFPFRFSSGRLRNYLPYINPSHRDFIHDIHLVIHFDDPSNQIDKSQFALLSGCQGLRRLTINVAIPLRLAPGRYTPKPFPYPDWVFKKIENDQSIRQIRGLQYFKLNFCLQNHFYATPYFLPDLGYDHRNWLRGIDYDDDGNALVVDESLSKYVALEERLRKIVCSAKD